MKGGSASLGNCSVNNIWEAIPSLSRKHAEIATKILQVGGWEGRESSATDELEIRRCWSGVLNCARLPCIIL